MKEFMIQLTESGVTTAKPKGAYHHGDLKAALINAAAAMLEKEGPEAISFRAIARETGVSQTAPYNHFQSKEHLLATVAEAGFRELLRCELIAAGGAPSRGARVVALGEAYVGFARAHPQLYRLMFGVGILDWHSYSELVEAAHASYVPVREAIADYLELGPTVETLDIASVTAWAVVHGLATLLIDHKIDSTKIGVANETVLTERVLSLFVAGFPVARATERQSQGSKSGLWCK
jgi:AcrR family transcriptional regulator